MSNNQIIALPLFTNNPQSTEFTVQPLRLVNVKKLTLNAYELISYNPKSLPIQIKSLTPLKVVLTTKSHDTYIEFFKQYLPGYQARVNHVPATVLESKNQLVMVPIKNPGINQIELYYVGTPTMRLIKYVSAFIWSIFFIYLIMRSVHWFPGTR